MAVGSDTVLGTGLDIPSPGSNSGSPQLGPLGVSDRGSLAHVVPDIATVTHVLAEQWNGTSWTVTTTVDPTGFAAPGFEAVSCAGTAFCMATGYTLASSISSFAEEWSGGTWSQTTLPASPTSGAAVVIDVSCISANIVYRSRYGHKDSSGTSRPDPLRIVGWQRRTLNTIATPADPMPCGSASRALVVASASRPAGSIQARPSAGEQPGTPSDAAAIGWWPPTVASSPSGQTHRPWGAPFIGSMGGLALNVPIVGRAIMPAGDGYDLVASDGGIFNFGSAQFYGSMGGVHLNKPIVGMAITADGGGYRPVGIRRRRLQLR